MNAAAAQARRTLLVLVGVVGVLVLVALIAVFTRGEPGLLDESTPEGVVQRYAMAVLDGDEDAIEYLTDGTKEQCGTSESTVSDDVRVTLLSTERSGDSASVTVRITRNDGSPFGSEYGYEDNFRLLSESGDWKVESAPWELMVCPTDGTVE